MRLKRISTAVSGFSALFFPFSVFAGTPGTHFHSIEGKLDAVLTAVSSASSPASGIDALQAMQWTQCGLLMVLIIVVFVRRGGK